MILSPAQLVPIDRRIVEEQMIALDPPFVAPSWAYAIFAYSFVPNCFAMAADGTVAPWRLADEIDPFDLIADVIGVAVEAVEIDAQAAGGRGGLGWRCWRLRLGRRDAGVDQQSGQRDSDQSGHLRRISRST